MNGRVNNPCYTCKRDDLPTYPTISPYYGKSKLIWICRNHFIPGFILIDAFTGNPICMVGANERASETN